MINKIPCTVGILTFNSENGLRDCLESVADFDEVIICDGGSTDNTLSIAREFGCKIIEQDSKFKYKSNKIADFGGVRNQTLNASKNSWFFIVDSDEYITKEVSDELRSLIISDSSNKPKYFYMPRKYKIDGILIDNSGGYPSYQPRFYHKDYVTGFVGKVHEKVYPNDGVKKGFLSNFTVVPLSSDYELMKNKFYYYLQIDREHCKNRSRIQLLKSIYLNLKGVVGRSARVARNRLFYKGTHMPLKLEFASMMYSIKLSLIFLKDLIKIGR